MDVYEISLNRRGINSVEAPESISVEQGGELSLNFINYSKPMHLSVSASNSGMYTDFFHQNLYIQDSQEYNIKIKNGAPIGTFPLLITVGYGSNKTPLNVNVIKKELPPPVFKQEEELPGEKGSSIFSEIPIAVVLPVVAAFLLYAFWIVSQDNLYNYLAFAALLIGVLGAWSSHR